MAAAIRFCHGGATRLALSSSLSTRTCQPEQATMKKKKQTVLCLRKTEKKTLHSLFLVKSMLRNDDSTLDSLSPSDTIRQFYKHINEGNLRKLGDHISRNCVFEDYSFPKPFEGKKEIMSFYQDLVEAMGPDMKFSIKQVCEGDDLTVGVSWNMEWKGKMVPFTRGCTFFECRTEGQRLTINKAQVVIESPIKIGVMALTLLKGVTKLFESFPKTTEWFLKSHNVIVTWFLRIYSMVMAPYANTLLAGYVRIWNLMAWSTGRALKILLFIAKFVLK